MKVATLGAIFFCTVALSGGHNLLGAILALLAVVFYFLSIPPP